MADVGPKIQTDALGDDFAAAKQHDPLVRCSLAPAFDHLSKSLEGAQAFDRPCHRGITGGISARFLAVRQGVSNHGEYGLTDPSADCDALAASNPDDGWNERGEGKAQAPARALAQAQEDKAGPVSGQAHDPGGAWA